MLILNKLLNKLYPQKVNLCGIFKANVATKKFTTIATLGFLILLNQNLVRIIKDSLISVHVGAEVLSYIRLFAELPAALGFIYLYTKIKQNYSITQTFTIIVSLFLTFFVIFAFIIIPNYELLHPDETKVKYYIINYPGFKWIILAISKWSYTLYYIIGELWPPVIYSLLFWQLINSITNTREAEITYPLYSFIGQASLIISGWLYQQLFNKTTITESDNLTEFSLKLTTIKIAISSIIIILLYNYLNKHHLNKLKEENRPSSIKPMSANFRNYYKLITYSKPLLYIGINIICYAFIATILEILWLRELGFILSNFKAFSQYHSKVMLWLGIMTISFSILGSFIIKRLGWLFSSLITPIICFITGTMFICSSILYHNFTSEYKIISASTIIFIGSTNRILTKACKYSLFDATKEMVYVVLSDNLKTYGKAITDIFSLKTGKTLGALVYFLVFSLCFNYKLEFILFMVFSITSLIWICSTYKLAGEYNLLNKSK